MMWLALAIFGWTCGTIGFLTAALMAANGGPTPEEDAEQARYLADWKRRHAPDEFGADW